MDKLVDIVRDGTSRLEPPGARGGWLNFEQAYAFAFEFNSLIFVKQQAIETTPFAGSYSEAERAVSQERWRYKPFRLQRALVGTCPR